MFSLGPKYVDRCDAFDRAAQNAVRSAELLADLAKEGEHCNSELVTAIIQAEHEGDQITSSEGANRRSDWMARAFERPLSSGFLKWATSRPAAESVLRQRAPTRPGGGANR